MRDAARRREEQPGLARYQVWITEITFDAVYASGAKTINIYDVKDNLVDTFFLGTGNKVDAISEDNPFAMPIGSPAFVEGSGTGAVSTDAGVTVSGFIRVA